MSTIWVITWYCLTISSADCRNMEGAHWQNYSTEEICVDAAEHLATSYLHKKNYAVEYSCERHVRKKKS
jgi:hypothetical protein